MRSILRYLIPAVLASSCATVHGQAMRLSTNIPECRLPPGKILPDKYYKQRGRKNEYKWVGTVGASDRVAAGQGGERADGSAMYSWLALYRIALNGDGYCDWYVNNSVPISTGGDRDSLNTIYLGGPQGWSRIGTTIPTDKPDELGYGKSTDEQRDFLFGEEPLVIHDAAAKVNYIVTAFYDRSTQREGRPGYRIYDWDAGKKTLRLLDKWQPGSRAAEVYAFFKAKGANNLASGPVNEKNSLTKFDPAEEAFELKEACNPNSAVRTAPELYGAVSSHLLARCRR